MKLSGYICHHMILGKQNSTSSMKIDNINITESREEKLLGITLYKTSITSATSRNIMQRDKPTISSWLPQNLENQENQEHLEKFQFFKRVSEHPEKSGKTVEKAYKSGRSQAIILDQCQS